MEASHYFLTPVYMEAPFLLLDVGLHTEDRSAIPIGVAAFGLSPGGNAVNLSASEVATSNLMLWYLPNLSAGHDSPTTLSSQVDWDEEDEGWI